MYLWFGPGKPLFPPARSLSCFPGPSPLPKPKQDVMFRNGARLAYEKDGSETRGRLPEQFSGESGKR